MGCTQSKIDHEESVVRCKQRKQTMKEAVTARNAFAAAHSSYITLLKNTGAALNDYGQGETTEIRVQGVPAHPQILDPPLAPPPLPFPSPTRFLNSGSIRRSASMPPIALQEASVAKMNSSPPRKSTIREDEDTEEEAEREENPVETPAARPPPPPRPMDSNPPPPPPPAPDRTWDFFDVFSTDTYNSGHNESNMEEVETGEDVMHSKSEIKQISEDEVALDGYVEDDEHKDDDTDAHDSPAKTPEKIVQKNHSNKVAEPAVVRKEEMPMPLTVSKGGKDLLEVLQEIDDQFLKASESGQEVSKMLEANRLHYHSNFADNKGMIDPDRVKRAITWNRSFKLPSSEDGNDNMKEERESHASVLDKLLAWEKKLYDEVKAGELMKIEYQKKIALLNKQKKRGRNSEGLEKTKAAVKYLHTRYMVDFQAMDSTSSEIQRLRDDQLYPNLVDLVAGMAKMWKSMYDSHCKQQEIVHGLRNIDISNAPEETTKQHYERTVQLHNVVNEWQSQSSKLVRFQKEYISALNSWLRLNLVPIESNLKEKVSSPQRTVMPPIHGLLQKWHSELDKLPETVVLEAIKSFAAIVDRILKQQEEERKQKIKYEETKVEHEKKRRAFEEWHQRYMEKKIPGENGSELTGPDPQVEERVNQLEMLRKKVDEEKDKHKKSCYYTRILSLNSLKTGLPAVFEGMVGFARVCSEVYKNLQSLTSDSKLLDRPMENGQ